MEVSRLSLSLSLSPQQYLPLDTDLSIAISQLCSLHPPIKDAHVWLNSHHKEREQDLQLQGECGRNCASIPTPTLSPSHLPPSLSITKPLPPLSCSPPPLLPLSPPLPLPLSPSHGPEAPCYSRSPLPSTVSPAADSNTTCRTVREVKDLTQRTCFVKIL